MYAPALLPDSDALCLCLVPKLRATSLPYLGLFESWIPVWIFGQCKMSHPAPFLGLGVAAGILLVSGTPVTWLPKKGCSELGHAGCSWPWAITHVALLTDWRSSHFQQGAAMGGRGRVRERSCHPRPLQWQRGYRDDV